MTDNSGIYLGGKLGASILQNKDMNSHGEPVSKNGVTDYTHYDNKNKTVFNLSLNVGYDFNLLYNVSIRTELDYTYRFDGKIDTPVYIDFDDGQGNAGDEYDDAIFKIRQSNLMLNGYYDFYNSSDFTPYLGAGVGVSFVKFIDNELSISKSHFAWALMAGASYHITDNVTANLEYRYLDSGKLKITNTYENFVDNISTKLQTHDINIGLRYAF